MFSNVQTKAAVIAGVILTMATLSAGQGFHLEWEIDNLRSSPCLPSYIVPLFNSYYQMNSPYNLGNEFNLENDGIPEIIIPEIDSTGTGSLKDIKIYDGASHSLKNTIDFQKFPKPVYFSVYYAFFDVDNDGSKELLCIPFPDLQGRYSGTILFINVQTNTIKYEIDSVLYCGIYDLDHDGHPEFWCVKGYGPYSLQIWGSGPTMAKSSSPALMKQNLARLIGNTPNPFVVSTKIEYYVPEKQNVQLQIFSSNGKLLRNLVDGPQKMGEYSALWDGKTDNGQLMAVGSYYYRLKVGDFISSKKMVELK